MKKFISILFVVCLCAISLCLFGCKRNNDEISKQEIDAAFAQASDLNAKSELPYDYLIGFEQYRHEEFISSGGTEADWEYIDWKNIDAGDDHPYTISSDNMDFERQYGF